MTHVYTFLKSLCIASTGLLMLLIPKISSAQISTFPYTETFGASGCGLPTGFSNTGSDPWDFQNTSETYMEGLDHTSGGGCFASMDDSGGAADDSCVLTSPTFDLTSIPGAQLRFWWQNSNSTTSAPDLTGPRPWSNLYVDISTNGGTTWTRDVVALEDSQQIGWAEAIVNLAPYVSSSTVIRFRGLETRSFRSDLSLDDILIFEPQQWDAELAAIINPVSGGCGDAAATVEIQVVNNGVDTITSLPVFYQKDGGTPVVDTITTTILPASSLTHVFSTNLDLSVAGNVNLKVWTDLALDSVFTNDTLSAVIIIAPTISSYPYYQDFEAGQAGWVMSGINSSWAFGTPNKNIIQGAASGVNAFVNGGLTGTYNVNENSEVTGPCFNFSSTQGELWVSLDIWYDAEFSWDGAVLQYSTDDGISWSNVGDLNDPFNWYTDGSINGNPGGQQVGWSGTGTSGSQAWINAKHALPASISNNSKVIFRIAFGSDGSVVDDGFAFDNFAVVDYSEVDLGPDQLSLCGTSQTILKSGAMSWGDHLWSTTETTDSIIVSTQGQYWVEFTDTILDFTSSDTIVIIESTPPNINFTSAFDTIALNSSTVLDPQLPFDLDYIWTPGNFTFPYLLIRGTDYGVGTYVFNLKVTDSVLCSDQASITVTIVDFTGLDEEESASISLYPNPVSDYLNVQLSGITSDQVVLELFGMDGKRHFSRQLDAYNTDQTVIDLRDLASGMYTLVVSTENGRMTEIIVKQ
ncbi:MAG: T9SS type A sorting domain-containing protein [Vicingaceae bacterium]